MSVQRSIEIPAQTLAKERRTCQATQYIPKNENPVFNFTRETYAAPIEGVVVPRDTKEHQRLYSSVAAQSVEIHDANGNLVTVLVAGLFEGCAQCFDRWAQEDGEV